MAKNTKGARDMAGVGPDPERRRRLVSMDDLKGFSIGKGDPDIRGWDVRTIGGRALGEVEDLLVDPDRGEVVMIEVELREGGVHAEVPIRAVQIDRSNKSILVDSGDLDTRSDIRARDRVEADERERARETWGNNPRDVRYDTHDDDHINDALDAPHGDAHHGDVDRANLSSNASQDGVEEVVIERRPVVEEVVVRRRLVDEE